MEWIATPDQRRQRYIDALAAIGPPPHCGCTDQCRARTEWHALIDGVLDAWLESDRLMGAGHGRPTPR